VVSAWLLAVTRSLCPKCPVAPDVIPVGVTVAGRPAKRLARPSAPVSLMHAGAEGARCQCQAQREAEGNGARKMLPHKSTRLRSCPASGRARGTQGPPKRASRPQAPPQHLRTGSAPARGMEQLSAAVIPATRRPT
jgi:hypothetical protein